MDSTKWTGTDDMLVHVAGLSEAHPLYTAIRFMAALSAVPIPTSYLASKVTPESRIGWGDFSSAAGMVSSLSDPGILSAIKVFLDDIDVAWVVVAENVGEGGWHDGPPSDDDAAAYLTMVDRPSLGGWHVHHLGDRVDLSLVPRDSRGTEGQ